MDEGERTAEDRALRAAGRGDQAAFAEVYDRLAPIAYQLARLVTGDRRPADEVCREAFVEAWRRAALFDPVGCSARSWVLAIVHRRAAAG